MLRLCMKHFITSWKSKHYICSQHAPSNLFCLCNYRGNMVWGNQKWMIHENVHPCTGQNSYCLIIFKIVTYPFPNILGRLQLTSSKYFNGSSFYNPYRSCVNNSNPFYQFFSYRQKDIFEASHARIFFLTRCGRNKLKFHLALGFFFFSFLGPLKGLLVVVIFTAYLSLISVEQCSCFYF